jgi:hypothetical protein
MAQDHLSAPSLNLTPEALQAMIAAAVTAAIVESRKPVPPTGAVLAELKMAQEHREQTASYEIQRLKNIRNKQLSCTHEHSKREGGGSQAVWVREEDQRSNGFILCQECQCRIRPGVFDKEGLPCQRDRGAIYDTDRFNKLFQECGEGATFQ